MFDTPEVQNGIGVLKEILEADQILRLAPPQPMRDRFAYFFVLRAFDKEWNFTLSCEALSDLPNMPAYKKAAKSFALALARRMRNPVANGFFCKSGRPISIEIEWPLEAMPGRASSALRIRVRDTRDGKLAYCYVVITHQQSIFDLKTNPFLIQSAAVNSIRSAIDCASVTFYLTDAHPVELQQVMLGFEYPGPRNHVELDSFLRGKVLSLAFRISTGSARVWISDPWDAEYLGCETKDLSQAAEILAASDELTLDDTREYASIGKALLKKAREIEEPHTISDKMDREGQAPEWDVFISHAAEDKESFVRPLATLLKNRGVRVWFDEFTLTLGDSLRRSIDRGLAGSRFGIVVLSTAFFSKEWPQRELDGLMAREISVGKVVLPIWHNITAADVRARSPLLADRFAVSSSEGLDRVADIVISVLQPPTVREP